MIDNFYSFMMTVIVIGIIFGVIGFVVGVVNTAELYKFEEIQEVREVDNGYYITINNEIYYKENSNDS